MVIKLAFIIAAPVLLRDVVIPRTSLEVDVLSDLNIG